MAREFTIGKRTLGPDSRPYVVAEIGVNHNGELALARKSIDAAIRAGADAVKFQTFHADEFMADRQMPYEYQTAKGSETESMYEMFRRLELPDEWHAALRDHARQGGIEFLSSAADREAVDLLVRLGVPAIKLASEDLINLPLLEYVANQAAPVILSTGMADEEEIDQAVEILANGRCVDVLLLHCVSLYPAPDNEVNLLRMQALEERYQLPVGYSDHSLGTEAAVGAVALGAVFIEKHFTLDRALPGPDHALSADSTEFARLVDAVRRAAQQRGEGGLTPGEKELAARNAFRRSVVAACDIPVGTTIASGMLCLKRPGDGLVPRLLESLVGKTTTRPFSRNEKIDERGLL